MKSVSLITIVALLSALGKAQTPPTTPPATGGAAAPPAAGGAVSPPATGGASSPPAAGGAARATATGSATTTAAPGATGAVPNLVLPTLTRTTVTETMPRAKVCSPDSRVCITVTDMGEAVNVMAEFPADAKWAGVGWGTAMPQADIVLGYMAPGTGTNRTFVVSDRKATGRTPAPLDTQQDCIPIRGGAAVIQGKWVMEFQRRKNTGDANDSVVDLASASSMIWGYHSTTPAVIPTSGANANLRATITKHTDVGVLSLNMQDATQVEAARQAGINGGAAAGNGTATPSSAPIGASQMVPTLAIVLVVSALSLMS